MLSIVVGLIKVELAVGLAGLLLASLLRGPEADWIRRKALPVMMVLIATGFLAPSVWIVCGVIVVIPTALARDRAEAAALFLVAMLSLPAIGNWLTIGPIYIAYIGIAEFATLGLLLAFFTKPATAKAAPRRSDLPFLLLLALFTFTEARGLNATSMLRTVFVQLLTIGVPYLVVSRSLMTTADLRRFMAALAFCGVTLAVVAVYQMLTSWPIFETMRGHLGLDAGIKSYLKLRGGFMRATGTFLESTGFSWFLAAALIVVLALRRSFKTGPGWALAILIVLAGIYATGARVGLLSAALGITGYLLYRRKGPIGMRLALLMAVVGGLTIAGPYVDSLRRTIASSAEAAGTVEYRVRLFQRGMEEIAKYPLFGRDAATVIDSLQDLVQGEGIIDFVNAYIYYGLVGGVIGIAILLGVFFLTMARMVSIRGRVARGEMIDVIAASVFSVALLTSVTTFTSGFGGRQAILFSLFLALGTACLGESRQRQGKPGGRAGARPTGLVGYRVREA